MNDNDLPEYLKHWPGLSMRQGDAIVQALPEDVAVAKSYPTAKEKGPLIGGQRITLLTKKTRYQAGEDVRVIHVLEIVEPGHQLFVMGPKAIYGELVDGKLVTPAEPPPELYDGLVVDSPDVDYNYDITTYRFAEPGHHTIQWRLGALRSNTLELEITSS